MNRQAEKLAAKFGDGSTYRMARGNAKEAPIQPLFHYTSEAAFVSIVKSQTVWFTSIYYMDDDQELSFGFGVFQELLKAALKREDVLVERFLKPLVEDASKDFEKIKSIFEFYSASFGQRDDAQQWMDYADKGAGVAIGLKPGFFALVNPKDPTPEGTTFLGKVVYGEESAKVRYAGVIDSAIFIVRQAFRDGLLVVPADEAEFLRHIAAQMYVEILWNSVTSKASKWSHQVETRLLALNYLPKPKLKIHNADKRPRVELPQPLLNKNIAEVMLGPKADDIAMTRVRTFLDENRMSDVSVTKAAAQMPDGRQG
jgi:hypothetical protein